MENNERHVTRLSNELLFSEVKNMLNAGYKVKISISGDSMKPFLRSGDLVVLDKFEKKHLSCGDVVLAYYNESYILHRIVKMSGNRIVLAGDGNFYQVEKVNIEDILAKVINVFRDNKNVGFGNIRWKIWRKFKILRFIYSKFPSK